MIMLPLQPTFNFAHAHNVENHHTMEDNFALRYVLGYPDVNSQAELVLSLGLLCCIIVMRVCFNIENVVNWITFMDTYVVKGKFNLKLAA